MAETDAKHLTPSVDSASSESPTRIREKPRKRALNNLSKTGPAVRVDIAALQSSGSRRNLSKGLKSLDDSESDTSPTKVSQKFTEESDPDTPLMKPMQNGRLKSVDQVPRGKSSRISLLQETPIVE